MTLLLAANRGGIDEQDRESPELIGGSDRKLHARIRNSVDNRSLTLLILGYNKHTFFLTVATFK